MNNPDNYRSYILKNLKKAKEDCLAADGSGGPYRVSIDRANREEKAPSPPRYRLTKSLIPAPLVTPGWGDVSTAVSPSIRHLMNGINNNGAGDATKKDYKSKYTPRK